MELIVFRGLARLSRSIIEVTSTSSSKDTVKLQGNEQLRSIARSINFLLRSRDEQHNKSVGIIQSLFPPHVFQSLQRGTLPSEHFEMTSILFCDLIGFKAWATATPPEAVAEFLSHFIGGLDAIAEKHGVIKIKTILDIYMAASGVPLPDPQHAHVMVATALEFHKFAREQTYDGKNSANLHVGVSSGPCAGGIIGKRNWIYDLWSDTVNVADEEATLFYEILDNELATMDTEITDIAWQNDIYQYIEDGDPQGYWTMYYNGDRGFMVIANLVATPFMFPNLINLFPREVLVRVKRDQPCNMTFPDTSVLFADICNFTLCT
eukprot:m51a1_g12990 putative adenylate guanylate cyclase catalytic domain protein (321) ;mRNA; f:141-1878